VFLDTLEYDPLVRPWYIGARSLDTADVAFWTGVYVFYTSQQTGLTESAYYVTPDNDTCVVAIDVLLSDILSFIDELNVGDSGEAFVIDADARLISGRGIDSLIDTGFSYLSEDIEHAALHLLGRTVQNADGPGGRVTVGGRAWWVGFHEAGFGNQPIWVGTAVPESEFLSERDARRWQALMLSLGLAALGVLLLVVRVRRYFRKMQEAGERRFDRSRPVESVQELIQEGESVRLEFKSTMRMNLATGKKGKEIEIAWLKTIVAFLNTDGGMILLGVDDDGKLVGLEADEFENDDKCRLHFKNLFNEHLGAEFTRLVAFDLVKVENLSVAVVECDRSPDPAFLKIGKTEDFYVRSGPSSTKLPASKALRYIDQRRRQSGH
jgi:hypothetical protein